jgi:hypothetical protein
MTLLKPALSVASNDKPGGEQRGNNTSRKDSAGSAVSHRYVTAVYAKSTLKNSDPSIRSGASSSARSAHKCQPRKT